MYYFYIEKESIIFKKSINNFQKNFSQLKYNSIVP